MDVESPRVHPPHHNPAPSLLPLLSSPRKLAAALVLCLFTWTALLGVGAQLFGIGSRSAPVPAEPRGLGNSRRRLLAGSRASAPDDEEDGQWAEKLLGDLQSASSDESMSATIAELRATLAAREERRAAGGAVGSVGGGPRAPAPTSTAVAIAPTLKQGPEVPRYNPASFAELQKAALAAAMPEAAKGPLPQLVRDMSAAMARQQADHEALQRRLAQLQPSVLNYNPKDVDQLSKAVGEATASQGTEVSGALPRLLRDLRDTLRTQKEEQAKMQRQLQAVASRKARSTKYATVLKDLVMRSSQMRPVEKMTLLFGELSERCAQAVDEARQKAELDREGSAESPSPLNEGDEKGKWQDTHSQLLELVQDEMRLAAEQSTERLHDMWQQGALVPPLMRRVFRYQDAESSGTF